MRPGLTPDQELFQANTGKFLDASVAPGQLRQWAAVDAGHTLEWWRRGSELGWTSPLVPESQGGGTVSGAPLADLALIAHQWGRHAAPGPLIPTNVAAYSLTHAAGDPVAGGALAGILAGEASAAWLPGRGGAASPGLTARLDGGELVLDGVAEAVEGAADAEWLLVSVSGTIGLLSMTPGAARPATPGAARPEVTRLEGIDLSRRWARMRFESVRMPVVCRQGPSDDRLWDLAVCLQQAESVGSMEVAFEMTMDWVGHRYSFGRPLGSYQEIKHRLADMKMWLEASAAITVAAIDAWDGEQADESELASAAKAYVGRHGPELVQDCVQIHGGIGVTFDHDLHLYLRRVTAGSPAYGTPARHERRLAEMIARRAA